ncbi:MAG: glutamate 5-kinase [Pseudomonadota bacterium]
MDAVTHLKNARRIVVKVGSALVAGDDGAPAAAWMSALAADAARLRRRGQDVILVSSGAVALGRRALNLAPPLKLEEKQAAAAVGQLALTKAWETALDAKNLKLAQLLLTLDDTENRRRYLNARATLETLLSLGVVPLVNENDTVATAEIRYGDNDRLAAHAAQMAGADCLVLLSDIDGLYTADPRKDAAATFIPHVATITPEIAAMAGGANSKTAIGSGGMETKLIAAEIAVAAGAAVIIAKGLPGDGTTSPLAALEEGARCTVFAPSGTPAAAKKRWIAGRLKPAGAVVIDAGAAGALARGKSLLPAGVIAVEGAFSKGDAVEILTAERVRLGRGLIAYDAADATALAGKRSGEIKSVLGYDGRSALIHRDNMALNDVSEK